MQTSKSYKYAGVHDRIRNSLKNHKFDVFFFYTAKYARLRNSDETQVGFNLSSGQKRYQTSDIYKYTRVKKYLIFS